MPWCEPCDRFYNPNSVTVEGHCPTCDSEITETEPSEAAATAREPVKVPWHFWLMVAGAGLYLGFRLLQLIASLFT
ncbi:MAG: hypothetical protein HKN26_06790 [Acidimicrobiales bacterium]|nr:hypothetical protein [Acidimicrobiales bacterium]